MAPTDQQISDLVTAVKLTNDQNAALLAKLSVKTIKAMSFEEISTLLQKGDIAEPFIARVLLDTATENKQYTWAGNYIGVIKASDNTAEITIKFNKTDALSIPFTQGLYIIKPFFQIFATWTDQAGKWVDIIVSAYAKELLEVNDYRSQTVLTSTLTDILNQLKGAAAAQGYDVITLDTNPKKVVAANTSRNSVIIQAAADNASVSYLGFDANVTSSKYAVALNPGDIWSVDDYQCDIYIANATATDKVSYGEV